MTEILVVVSHPDDEALYCGGTIRRLADAGCAVSVLMLTRGEHGRTLGMCPQSDLAALRTGEAQAAAEVLGVARLLIHGFPDGRLNTRCDELTKTVASEINHLAPFIVMTYPPDGVNGHPDHVAAHDAVARALAGSQGASVGLYCFASSPALAEPPQRGFLRTRDVARASLPTTIYIDVRNSLIAKLAAFGQYESQSRSIVKFMRLYPDRIITESFHSASADVTRADLRSLLP